MDFPAFILTKQGQDLLAKAQAGATLSFTKVSTGSGSMPPGNNVFSAVANGDVVTITNSEVGAASAADYNTGFTVAELTPGDAATAEETSVTCLAADTLSGGEYFTLSSPYLAFYVWFSVDGVGTDPDPAGQIGIQVDVAALDTAAAVASKLATALDHHRLDLPDLKTLIEPQQDLAVQAVTVLDNAVSEINVVLTNAGLTTGYQLRELGIFATDPDLGEVLYAVSNAGDNGDYFPAEGTATLIEANLSLQTTTTSASQVTMEVSPTAYASLQEFNDHTHDPAAHLEMRQRQVVKDAVRVASTGNLTLSGEQTIDGVAVVAGDSVLVKDQTAAAENGIYVVATGAWTRREDADAADKLPPRTMVPVKAGAAHGGTIWWLATDGPITLGTTDLLFEQPFARLGGSESQKFLVAPATAANEAVQLGQMRGKNAIINGNFDIWQRGTSFINPATEDYTADRWLVQHNGTGATITISRQAFNVGQMEVPGEPTYFLRHDVSVAAADETYRVEEQRIEGVRTFAGQEVTLSFYARSSTPIVLPAIKTVQFFGYGGTPSSSTVTVVDSDVAVGTSWAKYTVTFTVPSIAGKVLGTDGGDYLAIQLFLPINTIFTFDLAQVQLEKGPVATEVECRGIAQELLLCQRYFEKSYDLETPPGTVTVVGRIVGVKEDATGDNYQLMTRFSATKRAVPTVTWFSPSTGASGFIRNHSTLADEAVVTGGDMSTRSTGNVSGTSTTVGDLMSGHWVAEAEL